MNSYSQAFAAAVCGHDTENAYAKAFCAAVIGGINDGGLDVTTGDNEVPAVQVKSSLQGLKAFLAESIRRRQFIPICVGEPGNRNEMLQSIKQFGAWIGKDIPRRIETLQAVAQVRSLCTA